MSIFVFGLENADNKNRSLIKKWWLMNEIGKCELCGNKGTRNVASQFNLFYCVKHRNVGHRKIISVEAENEEQAQEELDAILVVNAL